MGKEGYSKEGLFGEIIHYDSKGNKIGESRPGFWGDTYVNYDSKGNKIGETRPGFFGEYNTFDNKGNKIGTSSPGFFGTNHYDGEGRKTGSSNEGFFGTNTFGSGSTNSELIGKGIGAVAVEQDQAQAFGIGLSVAAGSEGGLSQPFSGNKPHQEQRRGSEEHFRIAEEDNTSYLLDEKKDSRNLIRYIIVRVPMRTGHIYYLCDNRSVKVGDMVTTPDFDEEAEVIGIAECEEDALPCIIEGRVNG